MVAIQHHLPAKQAAIGNSFLVFCQNFGGAVIITIANTIFQESLKSNIESYAPDVSPEDAVAAGGSADAVRALAPPGPAREGVLQAYADSFGDAFYLVIATCCIAFVVAFGMGWVDLREKKEPKKEVETRQEEVKA